MPFMIIKSIKLGTDWHKKEELHKKVNWACS
jgi:hypothetical protein